ncbi:hypothetical protein EYC84_011191 [Monilinia fructicola]|uniref:Uncharacterized protein n=1 Tax=Monilinia fructicola TaxID=38448 RepID=A0A5M9JA92_MONFR|nr:hypothetical protein EYC84_011191 [Monilinia fructicola]
MHAHPYLPVGSKEIWVTYVPILAHHNSFLLHSMLALSASHISHNSPSTSQVATTNYHALSLHHRVLAIRGLSELFITLNSSTLSRVQKQTIQATLYSLTFQSYYLSDLSGFFELLYFFRGCSILRGIFTTDAKDVGPEMCLEGDGGHWEQMETRLYDLPQVLNDDVQDAETSLSFVKSLCRGNKMNWEFHRMLVAVVQDWKVSSLAAYFKFIQIYLAISKMSNYTFFKFTDRENRVGRVLLAHFLAVQKIMGPILNREVEFDRERGDGGLRFTGGIRGHKHWVEGIWDELIEDKSREWEAFMEWPRRIFS